MCPDETPAPITSDVVNAEASARAAEQARAAAELVTAEAAALAAASQRQAAERTDEIAAGAARELQNQEERLSWLHGNAEATNSRLTELDSRTQTTLTEMESMRTAIQMIADQLTPPVSQEEPLQTAEPGSLPKAKEEGQKDQQTKPRAKHRWT